MKRVLLIDLDTPVYASAASAEVRSIEVLFTPKNLVKSFSTRTEFKARLKELGKLDRYDLDYQVKDVQDVNSKIRAYRTLKYKVEQYIEKTWADEVEFFISGANNFRDSLELPVPYKGNRKDTIRPIVLKDVKNYVIKKYNPLICHGEEPDDAVIWRGYEVLREGNVPIVATKDKDAFAYSGLWLFNIDKQDDGVNLIPDLGRLWLDHKGKLRGEGFLWYCAQQVNGDKGTDGFKPTDLCSARFGDVATHRLLKDCKNKQEALQKVLWQYKQWFPEPLTYLDYSGKEHTKNYIEIAQLYHKACRMKVTKDDDLDFVKFCKSYGVDL